MVYTLLKQCPIEGARTAQLSLCFHLSTCLHWELGQLNISLRALQRPICPALRNTRGQSKDDGLWKFFPAHPAAVLAGSQDRPKNEVGMQSRAKTQFTTVARATRRACNENGHSIGEFDKNTSGFDGLITTVQHSGKLCSHSFWSCSTFMQRCQKSRITNNTCNGLVRH